ncbi:MAG: hypothetical protein COX20_11775 [Desulfobacterales bacterium CG23_combo_of_CG06-09_8_20_14_all_52_9]|nr:MAG: hypothetical protein COX20_11775 [Desulfobacterales bacterium CG23_combo_of_CG06-09_8_20_14_all_52_9]
MVEKIKVKSQMTALVRRERFTDFHRGKLATQFHHPQFGLVITPASMITTPAEAGKLLDVLQGARIRKNLVVPLDQETTLVLKKAGKGGNHLIFMPGSAKAADAKAYVLPESLPPAFFKQGGGAPREFYYDAIHITPESAAAVREIEINDPTVARFVAEPPVSKHATYRLVYHNYRDVETDRIRLKADALVLVNRGEQIYTHKLPGTALTRLPIEMILEEPPDHLVVASDEVKVSRKLYGDIYQRHEIRVERLPLGELTEIWPFGFPQTGITELNRPSATVREKLRLFEKAAGSDPIYGLAAAGSILHSAGKGLAEGALLFQVLNLAQNELKVAALLGFAAKASLAFYLIANSRAAAEVERLEAKERLGEEVNKQYPLWEMGAHYKTTTELIKRYLTISASYLTAATIFFQLFPPVFKSLWGSLSPVAASVLFVAAYLGAEFLVVMTDAFEIKNSFKIAENRLRQNPEFNKTFWTINAFQDNLGLMLNQASFLGGFGLYSLFLTFLPAYAAFAGITLGGIALTLCAARFMLPVFGREEKTRLAINSPELLRYGKTLKFSPNISVRLGEDVKVEVIEQPRKGRVIIPDFEKYGVKLQVANFAAIEVKRNFAGRILPFAWAQKQQIFVRTTDPADPAVIFTAYGKASLTSEEIAAQFIEQV